MTSTDPSDTPPRPAPGQDPGEAPGPPGQGGDSAPDIPLEPEGSPRSAASDELDEGRPVGPTPAADFWETLYGRRSIRRFSDQPVARELVEQVLHAGIWAPSSCNYQMWDLVAVDDPDVNAQLAGLSLQMGNAPVNVVVSYGRDFSEEGFANVQSASALIQNMSLAAHALGLGTFWITQMGDAERVREVVGLPYDRLVIAVLALGYPKSVPRRGPRRRPLTQVAHWNHYAGRAIPSSPDPEDWPSDLRAVYQRARVLNGLRHNKPRPWELRALETALDRLVPEGAERAPDPEAAPRWLDVLPCTGILTERLSQKRPGFRFDVVEHTPEVAAFCAARPRPKGRALVWDAGATGPEDDAYDVASCLYRLEDLRADERPRLLADVVRWLRPGGRLLLGFVNQRSFHDTTERLRRHRGGPRGVEYVLSPDPNIGPFQALPAEQVEGLVRDAGLEVRGRLGLQAVPQPEEIAFRSRNFSSRNQGLARGAGRVLSWIERAPGFQSRRGRFQYLLLEKPGHAGS